MYLIDDETYLAVYEKDQHFWQMHRAYRIPMPRDKCSKIIRIGDWVKHKSGSVFQVDSMTKTRDGWLIGKSFFPYECEVLGNERR